MLRQRRRKAKSQPLAWSSATEIPETVLQFVASHTGVPIGELSLESRLLQDLGVDGDDASELLCDFAAQARVDLSSLTFDDHFRGEPTLLSAVAPWRYKRLFYAKKPITIRDLVHAAEQGKWQ